MLQRLDETREQYLARYRKSQKRYRRTPYNKHYRAIYAKRPEVKVKLNAVSARHRNASRREKALFVAEYKAAHPCVDCGNRFLSFVMDLDHVRGKKIANVSVMVHRHYTMEQLIEEIEKCDVVCSNCHRVRTFTRRPTLFLVRAA